MSSGKEAHGGSTVSPAIEKIQLEVGRYQGQSIPRKEDKRLVQGQGVFVDDVRRVGMGYVHFVRSPYAHAKIVAVDVTGAVRSEERRVGKECRL